MNGFMGLLTVASLICSSSLGPGTDLPNPRQVPSQPPAQPDLDTPIPLPPTPKEKQPADKNDAASLPPGGSEATLAPTSNIPLDSPAAGLGFPCQPCPKAPVAPPLAWTCLRPPAPPVVDCRTGAWQQVYAPLLPNQTTPPVAPTPPLRVGVPWYTYSQSCPSQGIGNWKKPPGKYPINCHCGQRCCGHPAGCCQQP